MNSWWSKKFTTKKNNLQHMPSVRRYIFGSPRQTSLWSYLPNITLFFGFLNPLWRKHAHHEMMYTKKCLSLSLKSQPYKSLLNFFFKFFGQTDHIINKEAFLCFKDEPHHFQTKKTASILMWRRSWEIPIRVENSWNYYPYLDHSIYCLPSNMFGMEI